MKGRSCGLFLCLFLGNVEEHRFKADYGANFHS